MKKVIISINQLLVLLACFTACILLSCLIVHARVVDYTEEEGIVQGDNSQIIQAGGFPQDDSYPRNSLAFRSLSVKNTSTIEEKIKNSFSNIETSVSCSGENITVEDLIAVIKNVINSSPEFFYVLHHEIHYSTNTGLVSYVNFIYDDNASEKILKYVDAIQAFKIGVNKNWSDMEKIVYINDYIARL